jgi:hypothetical protein
VTTLASYPTTNLSTVAVGTLLAVAEVQAGSDRYRSVANFVDAFFSGFQSLLLPGHHPKWQEIKIMTELPGRRTNSSTNSSTGLRNVPRLSRD